MNFFKRSILCIAFMPLLFTLISCGKNDDVYTPDGRLILTYWEKWTGFEADAMIKVVDEFNKSQDKLFVRFISVSQIDRKLLIATAGGDPPDIAGIWTWAINIYADKNAIMPIDNFVNEAGISENDYIPFFYKLCQHRGHIWALPTTPASTALHWNKRLFREVGLDPEKPPTTIRELDEFAEKMTLYKLKSGKVISYTELMKLPDYEGLMNDADIIQMGFLPYEPGWWNWAWGYWFGGELWNGEDRITVHSPENVSALEWIRSYTTKFGKYQVERFFSGMAGQFASSRNAFLCGKIAMEMQGAWMYNFIRKYSPGLDWGAAPFPGKDDSLNNISVAEGDVLTIPKGAKHPKESFEFIKFVNEQKNMELLCEGHRKFSPLRNVSDDFYIKNPHPYIKVFRSLAEDTRVVTTPATGIWNEYSREFNVCFDKVKNLEMTPDEALESLQKRMQISLDRENRRLKRRGRGR